MPLYTMRCDDCQKVSEHIMGMDDNFVMVKCPMCGLLLSREKNRDWRADRPQIQGDTVAGGCNYNYYDENLGVQITSKQHRQSEMRRQNLREYSPDPEFSAIRKEKRYIKDNTKPGDVDAARAQARLSKTAITKRRERQIDAVFDAAPLPEIPD